MDYLARQLGTLVLSCAHTGAAMAPLRAAAWHNTLGRLGLCLPFFVTHDVGLLLTVPPGSGLRLGPREDLLDEARLSREAPLLLRYTELLRGIQRSEVAAKLATWRLRDELVAVLLGRVLGDLFQRWPDPAKRAGFRELPLSPAAYAGADVLRHFAGLDPAPLLAFLRFLTGGTQPLSVYTALEQIDLDTVRLLALFTPLGQHGQGAVQSLGQAAGGLAPAGSQLDLADLCGVFQSAEAADVVNFSLDLLPSVLETRRASGVQTFSADGYASIERRGNLDSLMLGELAVDDELFALRVLDNELFYYGHEKQRDEERRLQYILIDASPSMRGLRQVFARGLALTLAKKLGLGGDEAWLRFFDARLSDTVRVTRGGADYATPFLLTYRSERGRSYARVFRQLELELQRLRQVERRQVVLYIITHGQCHIPLELVQALGKLAFLYGIFIMPSVEVELDYLDLLDRHQVVSEDILLLQKERRDRALEIVEDAAREQARGRPST